MLDPTSRLAVLYGSQTGNAEDMAKRIGSQAKRLGFQVLVIAMDDYPLKLLPKQRLAIFVCSTTGHGQEPENMKNLYNFMRRRDLPKDCLSNLKFAVYGLGDSSYAKFNYVSKILYKRLTECGGQPLQSLVASDEQHRLGCDGIIYPNLEELWIKLCSNCDIAAKSLPLTVDSDRNSYQVQTYKIANRDIATPTNEIFSSEFKRITDIREAICVKNERITAPDHFQDTRHLIFKSSESIHYEPGDVCTIYPENSEENVQGFLQLLNLNPEQRFKLVKRDANYMVNYLYDFVPDGIRVEDLVRHYLDIQSIPKRSFFEHLWPLSNDELERNKLKEFGSTEGQEELYEYCTKFKRTILETLMDFPNTTKNITLESLFDLIPPLKPRSFSIASALSAHPDEIHLLVGVVVYRSAMKTPRRGLCSNYLARMKPVDKPHHNGAQTQNRLRFFIRHTAFKLPADDRMPIIMIGPGLGLAPFRSFIEERVKRLNQSKSQDNNMRLYFGCRHPDKDFYFKHELQGYANPDDGLLSLRVAFSRLSGNKTPHVQELLLEDNALVKRLLQKQSCVVYVAGNSKLPEELRSLLGKLLVSERGDQRDQSGEIERIINGLEAANRIQYDCW